MGEIEVEEEVIVAGAASMSGDNYEEIDHEIDESKLGDKLVQMNRQKGKLREFQVYDKKNLLVTESNLKGDKARRYRINLAWVSSEPGHTKIVEWSWLFAAMGAAAITVLFIYLAVAQHLSVDYCMIGGAISLTVTVLTSLIFMYKLRDEYSFHGQYGGAELFVMENKRPTLAVFDNFFLGLQQAIDHAHAGLSVTDRLVGELKMCRRLRDDSIIDDEAYTSTRTIIFKHDQYKA